LQESKSDSGFERKTQNPAGADFGSMATSGFGDPCVRAGVPNLRYMYPQGYICLSEGVHLRMAIRAKYI